MAETPSVIERQKIVRLRAKDRQALTSSAAAYNTEPTAWVAPNIQICLSDVTLLTVCRSATTERLHRETKQHWSRLYIKAVQDWVVFSV